MHIYTLEKWQHPHDFSVHNERNEKRTLNVVILTAGMMVFEIIGGWIFGSMALLADGWHMGTHAVALGITMFAYWYPENKPETRVSPLEPEKSAFWADLAARSFFR